MYSLAIYEFSREYFYVFRSKCCCYLLKGNSHKVPFYFQIKVYISNVLTYLVKLSYFIEKGSVQCTLYWWVNVYNWHWLKKISRNPLTTTKGISIEELELDVYYEHTYTLPFKTGSVYICVKFIKIKKGTKNVHFFTLWDFDYILTWLYLKHLVSCWYLLVLHSIFNRNL